MLQHNTLQLELLRTVRVLLQTQDMASCHNFVPYLIVDYSELVLDSFLFIFTSTRMRKKHYDSLSKTAQCTKASSSMAQFLRPSYDPIPMTLA